MAARALPDRQYRVLSVIGTRPEAIKMAPVVGALEARPAIVQKVLLTGQHCGLADALPVGADELGLDLRDKSVDDLRETLTAAIADYLAASKPDLVVVQGDTTSALAGALAARRSDIALAHVEAGLRSHQSEPWPEESNRVAIDGLADLLFAPTEAAAANFAAEPAVAGAVHVTGNSGIDALLRARSAGPSSDGSAQRKTILVTCHRRENQAKALADISAALKRLVAELPVEIVFPLHPNRHTRSAIEALLGDTPHILLTEPLPYPDMVRLMEGSWLILTDSGGLQEEGSALGRPVLVMRGVTERTEAPGNVVLVGTDPGAILSAVHRLLMDEVHYARMSRPAFPFGHGHAAPRIVILIEDFIAAARLAL